MDQLQKRIIGITFTTQPFLMCTTTSLTKPKTIVEKKVQANFDKPNIYQPSYRLDAFTQSLLHIIKMDEPTTIHPAQWGLIPSHEKNAAQDFLKNYATYNARRESVFDSPIYSQSIYDKRCLIISDGFYEPHHLGRDTQAYYAYIPTDKFTDKRDLFVFAGLYAELSPGAYTTTIITMPANPFFSFVHNKKKRMPLVLDNEFKREWLLTLNEKQIKEILHVGFTSQEFYAHPITKNFYKQRSLDTANLIEPHGKIIKQSDDSYFEEGMQGSLF